MQHIFITDRDYQRLIDMIAIERTTTNKDQAYLQSLEQELARATLVPPDKIPRDVITMHSKTRVQDLDSREEMTYTLTFPDEADAATNKISILAPIGTALIGLKTGDTITWKVPAGTRRLNVIKIMYQPEAAGKLE